MRVAVTIDVEQDCPPFAETYKGIKEGMPQLLKLLEEKCIPATFFTSGNVAKIYPRVVEEIVEHGHELGCHGHIHQRFDKINYETAKREIRLATETLRKFYPISSFRAPFLQFPRDYLKILASEGYRIDSSTAKHKNLFAKITQVDGITRIPASTSSLVLRMRRPFRNLLLRRLKDPVVLFVHPWEYVDLRLEPIRFDCRFNTGEKALKALEETIEFYKERNAQFIKMEDLNPPVP